MGSTTDVSALEFAGFWRRLAAHIIDRIIRTIIAAIVYSLLHFTQQVDMGTFLTSPSIDNSALTILIVIAYNVGFWAWRGQTPGKILMNIKIIRTNGSNISLGYAFLRCLGIFCSAFALGLGYVWIAYDSRKQGWHDKIADTYVIKLPATESCEVFPAAKPSA